MFDPVCFKGPLLCYFGGIQLFIIKTICMVKCISVRKIETVITTKPMVGLLRVLISIYSSSSKLIASQNHQFPTQFFYVKIAPKQDFKVVDQEGP